MKQLIPYYFFFTAIGLLCGCQAHTSYETYRVDFDRATYTVLCSSQHFDTCEQRALEQCPQGYTIVGKTRRQAINVPARSGEVFTSDQELTIECNRDGSS